MALVGATASPAKQAVAAMSVARKAVRVERFSTPSRYPSAVNGMATESGPRLAKVIRWLHP
jgi:hypothetical protein